jgi:hypothetical protein
LSSIPVSDSVAETEIAMDLLMLLPVFLMNMTLKSETNKLHTMLYMKNKPKNAKKKRNSETKKSLMEKTLVMKEEKD